MSDILPTYFPKKISYNNNIYNRNILPNSKDIFSKYDLRLSNNKDMFKLPKININSEIKIGKNKSKEELHINTMEDDITHLFKISKLNSYRKKLFLMQNKKEKLKKKISNISPKNKKLIELNELNQSTKASFNKKNYSLSVNPIFIKENLNDFKIEKNLNDINDINYYQYTERSNKKYNKDKIDEYISILLNDDDKNNKVRSLSNTNQIEKYSLENSIDPTKYIKKKFLDESYKKNDFKTSKIQIGCFNGNEELRGDNIKKINENNRHNVNLNSLKIKTNDCNTKTVINEMFKSQQKLNNFYFGKKVYIPKMNKNKNTTNIKNYFKYRNIEKENNNNFVLTLDDKMKNVTFETKEIKNSFIEKHNSRLKMMKKIRQFCDNYNGIVRRASIFERK